MRFSQPAVFRAEQRPHPWSRARSAIPTIPRTVDELAKGTVSMGKRTASAETLKADPRYNSKLASKFVNCLMWQGKKGTAERIFYGALDQIKKRMPAADTI